MGEGRPIFRRTDDTTVVELEQDTLVHRRTGKVVLVLNHSAAEILRRCDGTRDEADIARELGERFPAADPRSVLADVQHTVQELVGLEILER